MSIEYQKIKSCTCSTVLRMMYIRDTYNELWLSSNMLYSSIRYSFKRDYLKCGLTPKHYNHNYNYIPVGTALKTVTWVAETRPWLLRNRNTFKSSSAFVGLFENFIYLMNARHMEHIIMIFSVLHKRPDRLYSPHSLLFNGYMGSFSV